MGHFQLLCEMPTLLSHHDEAGRTCEYLVPALLPEPPDLTAHGETCLLNTEVVPLWLGPGLGSAAEASASMLG